MRELTQTAADDKLQTQSDEIQALMDKQMKEDAQNVQLEQIPHEDDTDDITLDQSPANYDFHHSK